MYSITYKVHDDILKERAYQIEKWGGPEHDDHHVLPDWLNFIYRCMYRLDTVNPIPLKYQRKNMLEIAALAIAALESFDRIYPPESFNND